MLGAIIGDIVGSIYEFDNIKTKDFPFFDDRMEYTDDSILTIATADWLLYGGNSGDYYLRYATEYPYPMGGYGTMFTQWVHKANRGIKQPYNSCGNGSAMRIAPVGWAFDTENDIFVVAQKSAECTHNHPEGIKGAQATALAIYMSRCGASKNDIRKEIENEFHYNLDFTCDSIRPTYTWGGTCQDSVPQAIVAFLDGVDFEDSIRNAISIGGDSDTIGCITGSIAEAFYGIPQSIYSQGLKYLPENFRKLVQVFENKYGNKII